MENLRKMVYVVFATFIQGVEGFRRVESSEGYALFGLPIVHFFIEMRD
jgi:hypothetical protein